MFPQAKCHNNCLRGVKIWRDSAKMHVRQIASKGTFMSIKQIQHNNVEIIFLDFEGVSEPIEKISHIEQLNKWIAAARTKTLLLISVRGFMPGPGFMDYATKTLNERATKIEKAAYIGLDKKNAKMFSFYDKYNFKIVERKVFQEKEKALEWLTNANI